MPTSSSPHVPGACYLLTMRGAYRSDVYFTPQHRTLLIEIVTEIVERFAGRLHCYSNAACLQLLIQVGEEPLGRMMLRVARRYAQRVHERLESSVARTLPAAIDVVNRLFEMRFARTQQLAGSAAEHGTVAGISLQSTATDSARHRDPLETALRSAPA